MSQLYCLLLVAAPVPFNGAAPLPPYLQDVRDRSIRSLHRRIGKDPKLLTWLDFLDPRRDSEFVPFRGERLGAFALNHSSVWTRRFFRPVAEPHANKVLPSRYYLSLDGRGSSQLFYEWSAGGYGFVLQEGRLAALLRIRPGRGRFCPREGIEASRVISILTDVLGADVAEKGDLGRQFRVAGRMVAGDYVTNAPPKFFGLPVISGWEEQILVFATDSDLCVLVFKATSGRQCDSFGLEERLWLSGQLVDRDGKSLMIDTLRKDKSRLPLPGKTVTIPR